MTHNFPPSVRKQEWGAIAVMAGSAFVFTVTPLTYYTWQISSPWGNFSAHWPYLKDAATDLLVRYSLNDWNFYWHKIAQRGWQTHFFLHTSLPMIAASAAAFWAGRLGYCPGGVNSLVHVSGPMLFRHSVAIKHAKIQLNREKREHPNLGLKLHPKVQITRTRESGNIFVGGAQGTGKTVFITPIIQQVIERDERAFIYDEKREFTALFFKQTSSILIAPWDRRGTPWNISADAKNAVSAQLIAERLIPDSNDPLWANGARMIFSGGIQILNCTKKQWGWAELAEILSLDEVTLNTQLKQHYPRAARFITEKSKTTQSFFAQLLGSLGWIYTLAEAWPNAYQNGFSITSWAQQSGTDKPVILVQADKRYKDIGAPIANALIALMTSTILAQTNTPKRELWLFIDELANLPKNDSLLEWMSLGRSKGCRVVAGTQSISQIQQIYTDHGADSLLNMFTIFASMRLGAAGETANYTAKAFGEREVERPTSSAGPQGAPITNWHREKLPLVAPSDLVHLPQAGKSGAEGYLLIPGWHAAYRLRWPIPRLPQIATEHCPAKWMSETSIPNQFKNQLVETADRREQLRRKRNAVNERN